MDSAHGQHAPKVFKLASGEMGTITEYLAERKALRIKRKKAAERRTMRELEVRLMAERPPKKTCFVHQRVKTVVVRADEGPGGQVLDDDQYLVCLDCGSYAGRGW